MGDAFLGLLKTFGFKEMKEWIAIACTLVFLANLLGGMMSALVVVNAKKLVVRPVTDRISFRLFALSELCLIIFALYYHTFMIEEVTIVHVIYWISAMLMAPLLAVIGSQIMLIAFSSKLNALKKKAKLEAKAERAQRTETMEQQHARLQKEAKARR